jgi:hypothetical protein
MCTARGNASGLTGEEATETGRVTVSVDICPNHQLSGSRFQLSFSGTEESDGQTDFTFTATEFTQDSLCCDEYYGGLKLTISGRGIIDSSGEEYGFNLALVQTKEGNQFEAELINAKGHKVFTTGVVTADTGKIVVENCMQHH